MINSKITLKKIVKLWLPIFFWSLFLYLLMSRIEGYGLSLKNLIKSIFPITFSQYWFMTSYFFMYLLIPILNVVVKSIKSKQQLILSILLGMTLIISGFKWFGRCAGSSLIAFCVVYCFGSLIRLNQSKINKIWNNNIYYLFLLYLMLIEVPLIFYFLTNKIIFWKIGQKFAFDYSTLFIVLVAILIFLIIMRSNVRYNALINRIATVMFGIYLISDNNYVREWLWDTVLHMRVMFRSSYVIGYVLIMVSIVFIVCGVLEYIRKIIFIRLENYLGNKAQKFQTSILGKIK